MERVVEMYTERAEECLRLAKEAADLDCIETSGCYRRAAETFYLAAEVAWDSAAWADDIARQGEQEVRLAEQTWAREMAETA